MNKHAAGISPRRQREVVIIIRFSSCFVWSIPEALYSCAKTIADQARNARHEFTETGAVVFLLLAAGFWKILTVHSEDDMRATISAILCVSVLSLAVTAGTASAADYLSMSGKDLYMRFCAACHGPEAQGDGPVSKSFKIAVPDLTLIARRQGGKFSADLIERVVDGRHIIGAHGTREMPVWGEEFTRSEIGNPEAERATRTVISRIVEYIATIQRPVSKGDE